MKKWTVLVLVVLGALLLALQYFTRKTATIPAPPAKTAQEGPGGVPLPSSPEGAAAPEIRPAGYSGRGAATSDLVLPDAVSDYKGSCEGSSLEEMRATHGKYWGYLAKNTPFSPRDTQKMYDFMTDYAGCVAMARGDSALCDTLPLEPGKTGGEDNMEGNRLNCREKVNPVLFIAYLAGKNKNISACRAAVSGWDEKLLSKLSITDFCDAAGKGPEAVNAYMLKTLPKKKEKGGPERQPFPTSESSCGKDQRCISGVRMYNAIRSGDISKCPPRPPAPGGSAKDENAAKRDPSAKLKEQADASERKDEPKTDRAADSFCEAVISRSAVPCETIVREMSRFYCGAILRTKKETGGYLGMSKEEIAADIAQQKSRKIDEEKQRKETEKIQIEINKKAKKIMGTEE